MLKKVLKFSRKAIKIYFVADLICYAIFGFAVYLRNCKDSDYSTFEGISKTCDESVNSFKYYFKD